MSVDLEVVLDHQLTPAEILNLPQRLDPLNAPDLAKAVDIYLGPNWTRSKTWQFPRLEGYSLVFRSGTKIDTRKPEELALAWGESQLINVDGPWLMLSVGSVSCALDFVERQGWWKFCTDEPFHDAVRAVCREFSYLVGSAKAIYLPDSAGLCLYAAKIAEGLDAVREGLSTDEIIALTRVEQPNLQLDVEYFDKRPVS